MGKSTTELNRVIKALKVGENIEKIDLYKNKIGNKQIGLLVQALLENNTVKRINLDCNEIDDKGAMLIAKLLEGNKFIDGVYLHHNKISNKGAKCLIQALENNDRILSLDLSGNKKIGLGLQQDVMKLLHRNILKTVETLPYKNEQVDQAKEDSVWLWLMKKNTPSISSAMQTQSLDKKLPPIVQKLKEMQQQLGGIIEEIEALLQPPTLQEQISQNASLLGNISLIVHSDSTDSVNVV
ncbi:hypothetical protein [Candidatus Tisiphia endosymbiont of Sialis lutaria]|uniref:hypothetical protein n=1 Tax=Candidatus Tisiphia endosymbiont of Sialis lutaria TaxID=2029164 RepID=UPI00312C9C0A